MFRQILGIRFYVGDIGGLLAISRHAGLVVVPSAPVLAELPENEAHRLALEGADFAITDSGLMVWLWFLRTGEWLPRISGLRYLRALLEQPDFRRVGATFWIMPNAADSEANSLWLQAHGFQLTADHNHVAPVYPPGRLCDTELLARIESARPDYVVICLGGGVQERLGHYLRNNLNYRPTLLCTGAAIAFLSGRQVPIPVWADRLMLGWLLRMYSSPITYFSRYWRALRVIPLLLRKGSNL